MCFKFEAHRILCQEQNAKLININIPLISKIYGRVIPYPLCDLVMNCLSLFEGRMPKTARGYEEANDVTPTYVRQLEKEKGSLESQLRDLEWRLDQESKVGKKTN